MSDTKQLAFLISPVRNTDPNALQYVVDYLERDYIVHWPARDTDQNETSYKICEQNRAAIRAADVVFVFWDEKSQGSIFDLGVAFGLGKDVRVINPEDVHTTPEKSFANFVMEYDFGSV